MPRAVRRSARIALNEQNKQVQIEKVRHQSRKKQKRIVTKRIFPIQVNMAKTIVAPVLHHGILQIVVPDHITVGSRVIHNNNINTMMHYLCTVCGMMESDVFFMFNQTLDHLLNVLFSLIDETSLNDYMFGGLQSFLQIPKTNFTFTEHFKHIWNGLRNLELLNLAITLLQCELYHRHHTLTLFQQVNYEHTLSTYRLLSAFSQAYHHYFNMPRMQTLIFPQMNYAFDRECAIDASDYAKMMQCIHTIDVHNSSEIIDATVIDHELILFHGHWIPNTDHHKIHVLFSLED